jgi:hypothetical protein
LPVDVEQSVERDAGGQVGFGRHRRRAEDVALKEHRAGHLAQLAVRARRRAEARSRAVAAMLVVVVEAAGAAALRAGGLVDERGRHRPGPVDGLAVDPVELEGALLGVGDATEHEQADGGEAEHADDEPGAQGVHHVLGGRSA